MPNQNFEELVKKNEYRFRVDDNGCWIWLQHTNSYDYATAKINKEVTAMHRYFYEIYHNKKLTSYIELHHICEVKKCINPIHLKETDKCGHRHMHLYRKLLNGQREQICDLYIYGFDSVDIAKVYDVTGVTVRDILKTNNIPRRKLRGKRGNDGKTTLYELFNIISKMGVSTYSSR